MSPRLHVLVGEGGVGKTTLAAGYALGLAALGGRVALLSVDPARRLHTALGVTLTEAAARVPGHGVLDAAMLVPDETLRRWATEGLDDQQRAELLENRLFKALADRLATTTDVIAAVRVAEWIERDSSLTDFVVDTAPGRNGVEFLRRPTALVALMQSRVFAWLPRVRGPARPSASVETSPGVAGRILGSLARIGGVELVVELARLLSAVETPFRRVRERLERAQALLHLPSTRTLLVTTVLDGAWTAAGTLRDALLDVGVVPSAIVVNQALPRDLGAELANIDVASLDGEAQAFVTYVRECAGAQCRLLDHLASWRVPTVLLQQRSGLDADERLKALEALGRDMCSALQ